ncbi:unnamed protein product [marine sediment metagenome]|uniref:Uncharacterized protein n=1 Tax=marine sediment metagenome TaxID=412755 RepID=X0Z069_9ZZZZ
MVFRYKSNQCFDYITTFRGKGGDRIITDHAEIVNFLVNLLLNYPNSDIARFQLKSHLISDTNPDLRWGPFGWYEDKSI